MSVPPHDILLVDRVDDNKGSETVIIINAKVE